MYKRALKPRAFNTLLFWMRERESIRLKKSAGEPPPWTKDPILNTWRFTNVRRRDDRVSRWIQDHVIAPHINEPTLGMFLALCRWVNWPETLDEILKSGLWPASPVNWRAIGEAIEACMTQREKTWTSAYKIPAIPATQKSDGHAWAHWSKARYVVEIVIERELKGCRAQLEAALATNTRQAVATVLASCYGWGSFMAGQVVDDWTWTPFLADATDHFTWAPLGPGSQRGLNRLYDLPHERAWTQEEAIAALQEVRSIGLQELGSRYEDLTLHDWQHCICEIDKYLREQNREGHPKERYTPAPVQVSLFGYAS